MKIENAIPIEGTTEQVQNLWALKIELIDLGRILTQVKSNIQEDV